MTNHIGHFALVCVLAACSKTDDRQENAATADSVVAAPAARVDAASDPLVVAISSAGPVLKLPPAMRAALNAYAPSYEPWRLEEYDERIVAKQKAVGALFGVVADYNGDGRDDVVLDGHQGAEELIFAIMSDGSSYRAVEIMRRGRAPGGTKRQEYLELHPAGPIDVPESLREGQDIPERLEYPGFQHINEGQGGTLHYWRDGRFVEVITGD